MTGPDRARKLHIRFRYLALHVPSNKAFILSFSNKLEKCASLNSVSHSSKPTNPRKWTWECGFTAGQSEVQVSLRLVTDL